jgi:hypothetical protein
MKDTFSAESFRLSPEDLAANNGQQEQPAKTPRKEKKPIEFYLFPKAVIDALAKTHYGPAVFVAAAVYKAWYDDYKKRNPVRLTSKAFKDFPLSKDQKSRGLKVLENTELYLVERFHGHAPLVTMKWKLIKD